MADIFNATAAFGALQQQDYPASQKYYELALKVDPNDLANNYRMAIVLLQSNPSNPLGFWYGAKALAWLRRRTNPARGSRACRLSSRPATRNTMAIRMTGTSAWPPPLAQTAPPADFVASIPLAPTQCDLAAQAVPPTGDIDLSFSDRELVLSCRDKTPANKAAADQRVAGSSGQRKER